MDMIFEVEATPAKKLPTLLQFLKSAQSAKLKQKYHCMVIWFPKDYPNITFQTEDFRVVVSEDNPLYSQLIAFANKAVEDDTPFAIVVSPQRDGGFGITTSGEKGRWMEIGSTGIRWEGNTKSIKAK